MRVYGALMWALSRVIRTPEVPRVYVGNFPAPGANVAPAWDDDNAALLEAEREDLLHDLRDIPRAALARKVNEFVKRVRAVRLHTLLMGRLRERMPRLLGRERKQAKLLATLPDVFADVASRYNLAPGDFPPVDAFRERLARMKLADFPLPDPKQMRRLEEVLQDDLPSLLRQFGNPWQEDA
jgi:EH domain-containing protein 1